MRRHPPEGSRTSCVILAAWMMAASSPAAMHSWRNTELRTRLSGGLSPNETFEIPRTVVTPGSSSLMRLIASIVATASSTRARPQRAAPRRGRVLRRRSPRRPGDRRVRRRPGAPRRPWPNSAPTLPGSSSAPARRRRAGSRCRSSPHSACERVRARPGPRPLAKYSNCRRRFSASGTAGAA